MPPGTSSTDTVTPGGQCLITWRAMTAATRAGILVGHEPAGQIRPRHGGDDGVAAAALDLAHLERRPRGQPLERRVARLAVKLGRADLVAVGVVVERHLADLLAVGVGQVDDLVREAVDRHRPVGAVKRRHDLGQRPERVLDRAPVPARVQVGGGAAHRDVDREHAARRDVQRRLLGRPHRTVGRHGDVGARAPSRLAASAASRLGLPISSSPSSRMRTFTGRRPRSSRRRSTAPSAASMGPLSSLVPRPYIRSPRTAGSNGGVCHAPCLARRLHVVVGVDEHRRRALGAEPLPEHERVPAGRDDTAAERAKPRREPRRRPPDVVAPGGVAAHAGDRNQLLERRDGHRHALTRSSRTSSTPACQTASQSACGRS